MAMGIVSEAIDEAMDLIKVHVPAAPRHPRRLSCEMIAADEHEPSVGSDQYPAPRIWGTADDRGDMIQTAVPGRIEDVSGEDGIARLTGG